MKSARWTDDEPEIASELPLRAGEPTTIRYEMLDAAGAPIYSFGLGESILPSTKPPITALWHEFKRDAKSL